MSSPVLYGGEHKATKILKKAGVVVSWRSGREKTCAPLGKHRVFIEFVDEAPRTASKRAVATTYKDACSTATIRVFWDRFSRLMHSYPLLDRALMGNVLAHEITHSLQDQPSHDETGMMKAHWEFDDIQELSRPKKEEDTR